MATTRQPGELLSHYRLVEKIGEGGMGVVFKALDTRLGRHVAIKVLPPDVVADPQRRIRFLREARSAASFSHPGVATIHEIDEVDGEIFIVMELLPGETLRGRLRRGALPVPEALRLASEIAAALDHAHAARVLHRDLKPENVVVTPEGHAKILDFGLAKILEEQVTGTAPSKFETVSAGVTEDGTILGTVPYMSPEQVRGGEADLRSDIWSIGCVLYETLTGRPAFSGVTRSDVLAAILTRDPDWSALPSGIPRAVRNLLMRCLEKERNRRLAGAGEAARILAEAFAQLQPLERGGRGRRVAATIAVAAVIGTVLALALISLRRGREVPSESGPGRLAQVTSKPGIERFPAWSPDGKSLVYTGEAGAGRKLFVKRLDSGEERQITRGDHDDIQPGWSPDGKTILFVRSRQPDQRLEPGDVFGQYIDGDIWSIDVTSGRETRLIEGAFNPAYSPDGTRIAVDASWAGPQRIWTLDSRGHNPQQVTTDVSEAVAHLRPRWSPDGARIVFQNMEKTKFDVRVVDLATKAQTWVTDDLAQDVHPVWSPLGRAIYFSSYRSGGLNLWRIPVSATGVTEGPLRQLTTGSGQDVEVALSRDVGRLAFTILQQNADIWKIPVSPETGRPTGPPRPVIASTREDSRGAWSPDGASIAFNSDRSGDMNIWIHSIASGEEHPITKGPGGDFQANWSPDGRTIAFFSSRAGNADIWTAGLGTGALKQLTRGDAIEINPFFSPDGTKIAYQSDQGGRVEVWVMNADGSGARQLTQVGAGGHFLRWTRGGEAIVFRCLCGGKPVTMSVPLAGGDARPFSEIAGGSHVSFSPDFSLIMDVVGHKALWISPIRSGAPEQVFAFEEPDARIDYPVWSPDGRWVLLDRFRPQGGDIWLMEEIE